MKSITRWPIQEYLKEMDMVEDEVCLKSGGKFIYELQTMTDVGPMSTGAFLGAEYEDGTFSIVGLGLEFMCSEEKMYHILWED